jgi:hypothetical protein
VFLALHAQQLPAQSRLLLGCEQAPLQDLLLLGAECELR